MEGNNWISGPWAVVWSIPEEGCDCFFIKAAPSKGFDVQVATVDGYQHKPEREASAYLIGAAPDLYEALDNMLSALGGGEKRCGHDFGCRCPFDQALTAMKRARGGE